MALKAKVLATLLHEDARDIAAQRLEGELQRLDLRHTNWRLTLDSRFYTAPAPDLVLLGY